MTTISNVSIFNPFHTLFFLPHSIGNNAFWELHLYTSRRILNDFSFLFNSDPEFEGVFFRRIVGQILRGF